MKHFFLLLLGLIGLFGLMQAQDHAHTLLHQGITRYFDVHLPPDYDGTQKLPVVMALHGGGGNRQGFRESIELDKWCDAAGYIAVYPEGFGKPLSKKEGAPNIASWNSFGCCPPAVEENVDDVAFFQKMLDFLEQEYAMDPKCVYATGISNGGMMCYKLACDLSDRITAVAPVAAPSPELVNCNPGRKVPILVIHGLDDPCALYRGGNCGGCTQRFLWDTYPFLSGFIFPRNKDYTRPCIGVPTLVNQIKTAYGLDGIEPVQLYKSGGAYAKTWISEDGKTELALCTIQNQGHTWPGGNYGKMCENNPNGKPCVNYKKSVGPISNDFIASKEILTWFSRHGR